MIHARHPLRVGVVHTDDLAVAREAKVALDRIGCLLPGQPEGSQRVFRGVVRRAAVGRDQLAGGRLGEEERERGRQEEPCHDWGSRNPFGLGILGSVLAVCGQLPAAEWQRSRADVYQAPWMTSAGGWAMPPRRTERLATCPQAFDG